MMVRNGEEQNNNTALPQKSWNHPRAHSGIKGLRDRRSHPKRLSVFSIAAKPTRRSTPNSRKPSRWWSLSKSLPPGSGTGDVKANVLILLDTSASMNGNPFGGAAIYNPNDLILLDDGDVMVGQARGAIIKFDYDTEDFDPTFVDPDGDGKGARLFQGSNSMPSCELETERQDSRVRTVREMDKSSDVNGVSPAGKEVIYSIS